jgi:excisionase family DNA binding protein
LIFVIQRGGVVMGKAKPIVEKKCNARVENFCIMAFCQSISFFDYGLIVFPGLLKNFLGGQSMNATQTTSDVLTRAAAAEYLHICKTTLDRQADIPRVRIGKRVLFKKTALDKWLDQKAAGGRRHG